MKLRIVKKWSDTEQMYFYYVERERRVPGMWQGEWEYLTGFVHEREARNYVKSFVSRESERVIAEFTIGESK